MNIVRKLQYNQNWNIGFCEQTPEELIQDKKLKHVQWLKHPYRDRWYADPFIYKVTEDEIVVFLEECPMENPKGIICELVIDRKTMRLKERYVLLELGTHLSYPAIIRHNGKVYVYPENGASGKLNIYEYNSEKHVLEKPRCILGEAVADATVIEHEGRFFMSATKFPDSQEKAFLYESDSLFGPFRQVNKNPYQKDSKCSRQGGNWIVLNTGIYRPAQNCSERYGGGLCIMKTVLDHSSINESILFRINPRSWRYELGVHTINHYDNVCVIDGCGFYYPLLARVIKPLKQCVKSIRSKQ